MQVLTPWRAPKDRYQRHQISSVEYESFFEFGSSIEFGKHVATAFCHSNQATGFGAEWNSLVLRM